MTVINNKGFAQLPILFAAMLVLAGINFYVIRNSASHKDEQTAQQETAPALVATSAPSSSLNVTIGISSTKKINVSTTNKEQATHKANLINPPQESKTGQVSPNTSPAITTPSQNQLAIKPQPTTPQQNITTPPQSIVITLANQDISTTTAKIEWQTSQPTESKLYLSGGGLSSKLYASEAGYTTKHVVSLTSLKPITDYSFQITAVGNSGFASYTGGFKTITPAPTLQMVGGGNVSLGANGYKINWNTTYISSCNASGDWSGEQNTIGEHTLSFTQTGNYTYNLICVGNNGESVSKSINVNVVDTKPKTTFSFNGSESTTNTYTTTIGSAVRLGWSTQYVYSGKCTASDNWSGEKSSGNTENLTFDQAGTFNYTLTCVNSNSGEQGAGTATVIVNP